MPQSEYNDIRDNDWVNLRHAIRRINERLAGLEGSGGTVNIHDNMDVDGNQILNGPPRQSQAASNEFITKYYLASFEAATLIMIGLSSGMLSTSVLRVFKDMFQTLKTYADNATAKEAGLKVGDLYRTDADPSVVCVVV